MAATKTEFKNCLFQSFKIPLEKFRLPEDGRKWKASAFNRSALFKELASFANADGTNIWPSIPTLIKSTGWSRSKVCYTLDELTALGLMERTGRKGQHGPAVRRLKTTEAHDSQSPTFDSGSPTLECGSPTFNPESPTFDSRSPTMVGPYLPSDLPSKPALQPEAWVVRFFRRTFRQSVRHRRKEIRSLFDGRKPEAVCGSIEKWHEERTEGFENLRDPFGALLREFDIWYDPKASIAEELERHFNEVTLPKLRERQAAALAALAAAHQCGRCGQTGCDCV